MAQHDYDALENGVLPWHHAQPKEQFGVGSCRHGIKAPSSSSTSNSPVMFPEQTRSGLRSQRTRYGSNWDIDGPKMQAVFLGPKKSSFGTGVFIPRGRGSDPQFNNKPDFSPVLLPSRIVQTLNLNVHELGQQIKPKPEQNKNMLRKIDEKLENWEDDASFSPEILLPEEWIY